MSFEGFEGGGLEGQEEGVVRSWVKGDGMRCRSRSMDMMHDMFVA